MYKIVISQKAEKQLKKLEKKIQERIIKSLGRIKVRPHSFVKKLYNNDYYSFRVGDYRAILRIEKGKLVVLVVELGHRKNIYKKP